MVPIKRSLSLSDICLNILTDIKPHTSVFSSVKQKYCQRLWGFLIWRGEELGWRSGEQGNRNAVPLIFPHGGLAPIRVLFICVQRKHKQRKRAQILKIPASLSCSLLPAFWEGIFSLQSSKTGHELHGGRILFPKAGSGVRGWVNSPLALGVQRQSVTDLVYFCFYKMGLDIFVNNIKGLIHL